MVLVILNKLPVLLCSLPPSINRVIVHVGTNDTARWQSELTEENFNGLFSFLNSCGKDIWLSGPLPTLGRGAGHYSRVPSLNTWLQSTCRIHNITDNFIENLNPFWNRPSNFCTDGLHLNSPGSTVLAANTQHAVQTAGLVIIYSPPLW